ncbi:Lysosomal thioesterase PPT2-A [Trichoplax sp. H2]|nr:Lysosomal thioesterase PPT2-A [Trichoplax sp. H2]|eukprot:RDD41949.1 Lysosomal thioesterase PPT2-A [Trichoplax sp. H2]
MGLCYFKFIIVILTVLSMASIASSYPRDDVVAHIEGTRPLVIIHGLFEYSSSLSSLKHMITKAFPKIQIYIPDLFPGYFSVWTPLWKQVESFNEYLKPIFANTTKNGINLLCFSQGGIICRGILQTASNHTVRNFISLSGPLMGQFGDTSYVNRFLPQNLRHYVRDDIFESTSPEALFEIRNLPNSFEQSNMP